MKLLSQVNIEEEFFGQTGKKIADPSNLGGTFVSNFIAGAISLAGVIFLILLIMGGIGIMSGSASDNPEAVEKGKKAATSALIGFLVVIASFWIVKLIEYITGLDLVGGI